MNLSEQAIGYKPLTIADGAAISDVIQFEDGVFPVGIFHPIMDTSVAFTFQVSQDGITYVPYQSDASAYSITFDPATASYIAFTPIDFAGIKWLKVQVADNQTGAKVLYLAVRGV